MTSGSKQLIAILGLFAAAALLGGLLYYRQGCAVRQQPFKAEASRIEGEIKRKQDEAKLTGAKADVAELEKQLGAARAQAAAVGPRLPWLGWPLGLLAVAAFFAAYGAANEHGKRFVVTAGLALAAGGFFYFRGIALGIDLRGGAELRYRMDTAEIDAKITALEERREEIRTEEGRKKLETEIAAMEQQLAAATAEASKNAIKQDLDYLKEQRTAEGIARLLKDLSDFRSRNVDAAVDVIRKRVDAAGIREVSVQALAGGRLVAQIPIKNITQAPNASEEERRQSMVEQLQIDVAELKKLIETPGKLTFNDVDACDSYQRSAARWKEAQEGKIIPGYRLVQHSWTAQLENRERSEKLLLRDRPITGGEHLTKALVTMGEGGGYEVMVYLDAAGSQAVSEFTNPNNITIKRDRMAILLDGVVKSAPTVESQLSSPFRITGRFTREEADTLVQVLNAGSLQFKPYLEDERQVGPGLGQDSIAAGTRASLVGSLLVVFFMGAYYLAGGLAAILALILNLVFLLGAMALLGGTMTLPGIAGIALTVGMAVDANVLIFERIREEKARGKPLKLAMKAGHDRAMITILDSNFTTLIIAFILYVFGTGPVKGFAVTLSLGLLINLFTALYVARGVLDYALARGWLTEMKMLSMMGVPKFGFMRIMPVTGVCSLLLVAGSAVLFFTSKDKYGLDFTGGVELQVKLAEPADTGAVRAAADRAGIEMSKALEAAKAEARAKRGPAFRESAWPETRVSEFNVQAYQPDVSGRSREFRISCQLTDAQVKVLEPQPEAGEKPVEKAGAKPAAPAATAAAPPAAPAAAKAAAKQELTRFFRSAFEAPASALKLDATDPFPMVSKVGKRVAGEMQGKALMAFFFSLFAIFIYIILRFDFMVGFGLGAVVSLFHDSIIAVGALLLANRLGVAGMRIDLVIVAAVLTIIGYSINDTIVVFDRIRENRPAMRSLPLREVIDLSVNQTLSRTILTSWTTMIAVLCLLFLGGPTLRPFALVFSAGIFVGTYSSIFIASAIGLAYENWRERRREALKLKMRSAPVQAG